MSYPALAIPSTNPPATSSCEMRSRVRKSSLRARQPRPLSPSRGRAGHR
jgi:hypothetical protein